MVRESSNSILLLLGIFLLFSKKIFAQETDTLQQTLSSVVVKGKRVRSYLRQSEAGSNLLNLEMMQQMPRILGNADPLHYVQMLPGVQTTSEYDAGLHIQGSDNSHNQVAVNGVPLYNVNHALGFFSAFNASHYSAMLLTKSPTSGSAPNRLGGGLDMLHKELPDSVLGGGVSVGPMSSQGTLRIPTGRKAMLTVSGRAAYLNLFYSPLLTMDNEKIRYGFSDYNMTFLYNPNKRNKILLDAYYGNDDFGYEDRDYASKASFKWSNLMFSAHWDTEATNFSLNQTAYMTSYQTKLNLALPNINMHMPSNIIDWGYKAKFRIKQMTLGADFIYHDITPQHPKTSGMIEYSSDSIAKQKTFETSVYASWKKSYNEKMLLETALRSNSYCTQGKAFFSMDPSLSFMYSLTPNSSISVGGGIKHQYLFKTGFSDVGLPTEFWLSSDRTHLPQYAYHASLSNETYFQERTYRFSVELYYKRLFHQVEYSGNVFDFIYSKYNLDNVLLHGNGNNYGLNLMIEKRKGSLIGWLGYSLGRALRRFPDLGEVKQYSARHERLHEFNAVATYRFSQHWSMGTTFVLASGTPYTKAKYLYLINNNIVTEFGEYNAERLSPYLRLDLSVNYEFGIKKGRRNGINVSLYNATARKNQLFYRVKVTDDKKFAYRPLSFVLKTMPSINYYYNF